LPVILARELRQGCIGYAEVKALPDGPSGTVPASGDVLVVEAARPPTFLARGASRRVRRGVHMVLVTTRGAPVPTWTGWALPPPTMIVSCNRAAPGYGFGRAAVAVARLVGAPSAAQLTREIVEARPRLGLLADLLRAVCEDPWVVRRPRDLAASAGVNRNDIVRRCERAGFARAEYFIAIARAELFRCLMECHGRRPMAACQLSGIGDRTNFRRVVARAKRRVEWAE
jgi:hypothetical protein